MCFEGKEVGNRKACDIFKSQKKKETEAHNFFCNASDVEIGLREAIEACGQQTKQPEQVN